jgi:hypothetical protein
MTEGPSNRLSIQAYLHCGLCIKEWKAGKAPGLSPADYAALEIGWTREGLQVWCKRHDCNVLHIDFEGQKHPANLTRPSTTEKENDQDDYLEPLEGKV